MKMLKDRDGLALYRLLEFPRESAESWPIAETVRDQGPIPYLRFIRDPRRGSKAAQKDRRLTLRRDPPRSAE